MATTTLTIRLTTDAKARLGRLADATRRSRAFLAAEAVEAYLDRELPIVEGILAGLEDARAGRTLPHEEAMAEIDAVIAAAARRHGAPDAA